MHWVASHWQLADGLTKTGLSERLSEILITSFTKLHEESAHKLHRQHTQT